MNDNILINSGCLLYVRNPLNTISIKKLYQWTVIFKFIAQMMETAQVHKASKLLKDSKPRSLVLDNMLNPNLIWKICRKITKVPKSEYEEGHLGEKYMPTAESSDPKIVLN